MKYEILKSDIETTNTFLDSLAPHYSKDFFAVLVEAMKKMRVERFRGDWHFIAESIRADRNAAELALIRFASAHFAELELLEEPKQQELPKRKVRRRESDFPIYIRPVILGLAIGLAALSLIVILIGQDAINQSKTLLAHSVEVNYEE